MSDFFPAEATDRQWWNTHKNCGGCGDRLCHPDIPCTPGDEGCRYCPNRTTNETRLLPPIKHQEIEGQSDIFGATA